MKTIFNKSSHLFFFLSLVFLFISCEEEPDLIGLNLQPQSEKLVLGYSDTTSIIAYSLIDDSMRTDNYPLCLMGSYNDAIFGSTSASIFTQLRLSDNNVSFGTNNPTFDSLLLFLPYAGGYTYNNPYVKTTPINLKVYEVDEKMSIDSLYYSDKLLAYKNSVLADYTFTPNPKDSVIFNKIKYPPMLIIRLNNILANKLLSAASTDLTDNDVFTNFIKGLYIKAMPLSTSQVNKGSISYFNLYSSALANMTLYYKKNPTDTFSSKYTFLINDKSSKYTYFDHYNYLNAQTDLRKQIGSEGFPTADTNLGKQKLYLQSMGGIKLKLKFPYIREWIKNQNIIVNEAVLVLKNADVDDNNTPPSLLAALKRVANGKTELLPDYIEEGSSFIDATYNSTSREYRIRITRYFQKMLNSDEVNYGLFLFTDSRRTSANRFVFYGTDKSLTNRMKLELKYTIIK